MGVPGGILADSPCEKVRTDYRNRGSERSGLRTRPQLANFLVVGQDSATDPRSPMQPDMVLDPVGGLVFGHRPKEDFPRALAIESHRTLGEVVQNVFDLLPGQAVFHGPEDAGMLGTGDVLADEQLFKQLFGGPEAREANFNVAIRMLIVPDGVTREL